MGVTGSICLEGAEGEAMDALKDAAFAPFDIVIVGRSWMLEASSHEEALHLHGEKGLVDGGGI